jgi:hypothetical protein
MRARAHVIAGLSFLLAATAWAQPAATPAAESSPPDGVVRAEAPIVDGNALMAKKRALAEAFRQVVERAFTDLLKEGAPMAGPMSSGIAQLKNSFATSAQRFVRSYRLLEQDTEGGMLRIMIDADVDTVALRREIDRIRGSAAGPTVAPPPKPTADFVLVAGPAPGAGALVSVLAAAGIKAHLDPAPDEARLVASAASQGATAVFVRPRSVSEGLVPGTPKLAIKCNLNLRMFRTGFDAPRGPVMDRTDEDRGFASNENAARDVCFARVAATAARMVAIGLRAPAVSAQFVTLQLDIADAGPIPVLMQALKRLGMVTATEVRQIGAKMAEIRVFTRVGGPVLLQALAHEVAARLSLTPTQATSDLLVLVVRAADAPPVEDNR